MPNETLKSLRFGIEIETIRCSREKAARAVQTVVGGTVRAGRGLYDAWECVAPDGRVWKAMRDGSLSDQSGAEVVSPILGYADLDTLQKVVRALHDAGAKVDATCGIHIHVGTERFDADGIARLAKLIHQQEDLLVAALGVQARRIGTYTKPMDARFIAAIAAKRNLTMPELSAAWYGQADTRRTREHYDSSRYHGLNLHSHFFRGTAEFRYFEATLHAGKVKAYVQLALALAAKALDAKTAIVRKRTLNPATAKYDFRVFLLRLGLIGDEFKTARLHLLANLGGSAAWKNGRPVAAAPVATVSA